MAKADLAVIGGTGVYQISMLEKPQQLGLETRYGRVDLLVGDYQGRRVAFFGSSW